MNGLKSGHIFAKNIKFACVKLRKNDNTHSSKLKFQFWLTQVYLFRWTKFEVKFRSFSIGLIREN